MNARLMFCYCSLPVITSPRGRILICTTFVGRIKMFMLQFFVWLLIRPPFSAAIVIQFLNVKRCLTTPSFNGWTDQRWGGQSQSIGWDSHYNGSEANTQLFECLFTVGGYPLGPQAQDLLGASSRPAFGLPPSSQSEVPRLRPSGIPTHSRQHS